MKRFIFSAVIVAGLLLSSSLSPSAYSQKTPTGTATVKAARAHSAVKLTLPLKKDSLKFAVMGDTGTGSSKQTGSRGQDGPVSLSVPV